MRMHYGREETLKTVLPPEFNLVLLVNLGLVYTNVQLDETTDRDARWDSFKFSAEGRAEIWRKVVDRNEILYRSLQHCAVFNC